MTSLSPTVMLAFAVVFADWTVLLDVVKLVGKVSPPEYLVVKGTAVKKKITLRRPLN
jgi:hypothetical protein